uniref:Uncharacterized protein n=1 Tax=Nelumbo nucifera TaxID=4432 RepID=A0A822XK95_NELNU|nr:TPA_asm: hypothetical protein HUJ06_020972 [Nelumbo nucifera]
MESKVRYEEKFLRIHGNWFFFCYKIEKKRTRVAERQVNNRPQWVQLRREREREREDEVVRLKTQNWECEVGRVPALISLSRSLCESDTSHGSRRKEQRGSYNLMRWEQHINRGRWGWGLWGSSLPLWGRGESRRKENGVDPTPCTVYGHSVN